MATPAPSKYNLKGKRPGNLAPENAEAMKASSAGGADEAAPAEEKVRVEGSEASTVKPPEQKVPHEKLPAAWTGGGGWRYRKVEGGIVATNPKTGADVRVNYGSKDYNDIVDEVARGDAKPGQVPPQVAQLFGGDEAAPADFTVESEYEGPSGAPSVPSESPSREARETPESKTPEGSRRGRLSPEVQAAVLEARRRLPGMAKDAALSTLPSPLGALFEGLEGAFEGGRQVAQAADTALGGPGSLKEALKILFTGEGAE